MLAAPRDVVVVLVRQEDGLQRGQLEADLLQTLGEGFLVELIGLEPTTS